MPRNSSGTYSLPAGNPVVTGTTISSVWANTTLSDIGTAMTDSLSRSGDGGMLAPLELVAGAIGAPSLTWGAETTSGLYRAAAGDFRFSISATDVLIIRASQLFHQDGTAGAPGISFIFDADSGIYRIGANNIGVSVNGAKVLDIATTGLTVTGTFSFTGALLAPDGSVGAPAYSFTSDPDTGMYRPSANVLSLVAGGVQALQLTSTQLLSIQDGTAAAPAYSFFNDPDCGLYRSGANNINFATAGVRILNMDANGVYFNNGTVSLPTISFFSDQNTGIFWQGADDMRLVAGGVSQLLIRTDAVYARLAVWGADGALATPSYSFESDPDTGLFRAGANDIRMAAGAAFVQQWNATGAYTVFQDGAAAAPSISFFSDTDTGIYRGGANNLNFATGGVRILNMDTNGVYFNDGTVSLPTISFFSDSDTGFYRAASGDVRFTSDGVLSWVVRANGAFFVTGSAANPGISFINDTNTGFYNDVADQIAIALGGVTAGQIAQGTFTMTAASGLTTNPTVTCTYKIVGNFCILSITSALTGTSNATNFQVSGIPVVARPATNREAYCKSTDNSVANGVMTLATVLTGGNMDFQPMRTDVTTNFVGAGGYTTSGTKGLQSNWSIMYPLT